MRYVRANYEPGDGKKGTLFKTFDPDVDIGDLIVVPTDTRVGLTVCVVSEVDVDVDFKHGSETAHWIVDVVDPSSYSDVVEKERQALRTMRQAELHQQREDMANAMFANQKELLAKIEIAKIDMQPEPAEPQAERQVHPSTDSGTA